MTTTELILSKTAALSTGDGQQSLAALQRQAADFLAENRFAFRKNEVWRNVDFGDFMDDELTSPLPDNSRQTSFSCDIPDLDTTKLTVCNGYYKANALGSLPSGVIICSLREALDKHPQLVEKVLGQTTPVNNSFLSANTALFTDGVFIYIPDGITVEKPLQILSVADYDKPMLLQTRNLVYIGKNSQLTLIHCDDSYNHNRCFSNTVTEIVIDEDARLNHYKMQNLNDNSGLINQTFVRMRQNSSLLSNGVSFNGGNIRNHNEIRMDGEHCNVQVHGLYLMDKEQKIDNYVYVEHSHPNCDSYELFKGILDDNAHGSFNGHVLVCDGAFKTNAQQSNKNILLTDKATINSKPFLEIYNDDVKCSHGSSIGQLDEQALFYMMQRGIRRHTATTLLMFAFCDEVLKDINIAPLQQQLREMVRRRLQGELTSCDNCVIGCNTNDCHFPIDTSRL